jgi:hypothetical protein
MFMFQFEAAALTPRGHWLVLQSCSITAKVHPTHDKMYACWVVPTRERTQIADCRAYFMPAPYPVIVKVALHGTFNCVIATSKPRYSQSSTKRYH